MTPDHHTQARLPDSPPHWLESYPAHLSRTWTLASGESLRVRPVRHDDGELEEAFVRALSLESRYQRMLSGGTKVTPEWIDSMTHIDYQHHMAFAVTTVVDGVEQFVVVDDFARRRNGRQRDPGDRHRQLGCVRDNDQPEGDRSRRHPVLPPVAVRNGRRGHRD